MSQITLISVWIFAVVLIAYWWVFGDEDWPDE